jgi:uncharacterized tellurite resistance protein B-like protein
MLSALRKLLSPAEDVEPEVLLHKAAALLMLEVGQADDYFDATEREVMLQAIGHSYGLSASECQDLLVVAEQESEELLSIQSLTRLLVDECDLAQRQKLLVDLWRVAYADGNIDKYEEHIIRRIADLLYVPHTGFIQAKLSAQAATDL